MNKFPLYEVNEEVIVLDHRKREIEGVFMVRGVMKIKGEFFYTLYDVKDTFYPENALFEIDDNHDTYSDYMDDHDMWDEICFDEDEFPLSDEGNRINNQFPKEKEEKKKPPTIDEILDAYNVLRYLGKTTKDQKYHKLAREIMKNLEEDEPIDLANTFRFLEKNK